MESILIPSNKCSTSCRVEVVLFCKGRGGDPNTYRPNSDETQYVARRDALVRCVSSFLFGPKDKDDNNRELIMLFDEDMAILQMTLDKTNNNIFPKEQIILSLWKRAALNLNEIISFDGMICRISLNPTRNLSQDHASLPTGLSKRQIIEYLQKHCTLDFLRSNRLNCSVDVILRKTNQKKLMDVWNDWTSLEEPDGYEQEIQSFYCRVLTGKLTLLKNGAYKTVAGILHESCPEFPCFGLDSNKNASNQRLVLFLGAVRDMTALENQILDASCKETQIPLIRIRFGCIPEFTSKILCILSMHHAQNKLDGSVQRLLSENVINQSSHTMQTETSLNVICVVPIPSFELSTDLSHRDRIHWCLVRVIVCTLWRSKLASSETNEMHSNSLSYFH